MPSVTEANQTIDKVMLWFEVEVAKLNRDQQAKLGVSRITIKTPDGQIVLDWVDDLELGQATGYWADGITNYWFPTPGPAPPTSLVCVGGSRAVGVRGCLPLSRDVGHDDHVPDDLNGSGERFPHIHDPAGHR